MRIIVLITILLPTLVFAHATGTSWEAMSGQYSIDVGYDLARIMAGDTMRFDFNLLTKEENPADFDEVWVRILHGTDTELATGIHHQPLGPTTLLYTFSKSGPYVLDVSFRADAKEIATASFPLSVNPPPTDYLAIAEYIGAALVGAAGVLLIQRRRIP